MEKLKYFSGKTSKQNPSYNLLSILCFPSCLVSWCQFYRRLFICEKFLTSHKHPSYNMFRYCLLSLTFGLMVLVLSHFIRLGKVSDQSEASFLQYVPVLFAFLNIWSHDVTFINVYSLEKGFPDEYRTSFLQPARVFFAFFYVQSHGVSSIDVYSPGNIITTTCWRIVCFSLRLRILIFFQILAASEEFFDK